MTANSLFSHMLDPEKNKKLASLCADIEPNFVENLTNEVDEHVTQVHLALKANEFLDVNIATKIADILKSLLNEFDKYPKQKQRLIVGAARYFIKSNDAQADFESLLGFDDDIEVLNYVLVELGCSDMRIQL